MRAARADVELGQQVKHGSQQARYGSQQVEHGSQHGTRQQASAGH
jgi:hypothetical protein